MDRFVRGEDRILVATTVIEVGVDVPNATVMLIEHAERFGLSQLHQLRGRVSRGGVPGQCYLFAGQVGEEARRRLRALLRTADGFALAEEDARMRGVGELFGTRQHGAGELSLAGLAGHMDLLEMARKDAFALVAVDAGLRRPEHSALRAAVWGRYGETLELAEVG
jgi:ATP-dependent DNA helicase RecG